MGSYSHVVYSPVEHTPQRVLPTFLNWEHKVLPTPDDRLSSLSMSASHIIYRSTNQNVASISQVAKTPIRHFESISWYDHISTGMYVQRVDYLLQNVICWINVSIFECLLLVFCLKIPWKRQIFKYNSIECRKFDFHGPIFTRFLEEHSPAFLPQKMQDPWPIKTQSNFRLDSPLLAY